MLQRRIQRCSFRESIKTLEDDIHHANRLVAAIPKDMAGDSVQMKLSYSPCAPLLLFLVEWMNSSSLDTLLGCMDLLHVLVYKVYVDGIPKVTPKERKATLREFYAVIYPMLEQLQGNIANLKDNNLKKTKVIENQDDSTGYDSEEECGICMEIDSKVVLPQCGHSLCVGCYSDWYVRSRSCPFCRGSLKRVSSGDLWILTSNSDVVDIVTLVKENLRCFFLYIEQLPLVMMEDNLLMYHYLM